MIDVPCMANHIYTFSPDTTALLVIDMQRDFCDPHGVGGESGEDVSFAQKIIPRVRAVLDAARENALTIIHTREGHTPDLSTLHEMRRLSSKEAGAEIGAKGPLGRFLVRGEYGHDFVDELQPQSGETVIDKPGFSAFFKTNLEDVLHQRGITQTIVCGVTTECCVQSTIRGAVDRGFHVLTLDDCCASYYEDMHEATMRMLPAQGGLFGRVASSGSLLRALKDGASSIKAAS